MTDVIRDMPPDDRPRERLLAYGPRTLSDAELMGIVLGCGTYGKNAMQLARELLTGGFDALAEREPAQMARLYGMGSAKAARVAATFEIARRISKQKPRKRRATFDVEITGSELVRALHRHRQERLGAYFLGARSQVLQQREIFVGTVDKTFVSTRDVLRIAFDANAVGVVVYHNHPSGDPTPSPEDVNFSKKLHEGLALADIELVDHLVIGAHGFVSMKRKGIF